MNNLPQPAGAPPAPRRPVLEVQGLSKAFTLHLRNGLQLPVLRDVSLRLGAGECVALVGASGQGKSTFMKCLYGSYGADEGRIVLHSAHGPIDLAQATPQEVLSLRRRELAYVSQFLRAVPRVPALEVVVERVLQAQQVPLAAAVEASAELDAAEAWPGDDDRLMAAAREQAQALFSRLNLPRALWELPPATFSGGEQQRVNIARGFIAPARLLLLDEPTASLDAVNRRVVVQLIQEAKARGTAIVGIFHDEEVRDAVATRCVTLA
ncbi:MAG: ATP-binding cassette domain-containing protein [Pseudomonadota bacterium]